MKRKPAAATDPYFGLCLESWRGYVELRALTDPQALETLEYLFEQRHRLRRRLSPHAQKISNDLSRAMVTTLRKHGLVAKKKPRSKKGAA